MTAAVPTTADQTLVEAAVRGATAAAGLLPSSAQLVAAPVTSDLAAVDLPDVEARAVVAKFTGAVRGAMTEP